MDSVEEESKEPNYKSSHLQPKEVGGSQKNESTEKGGFNVAVTWGQTRELLLQKFSTAVITKTPSMTFRLYLVRSQKYPFFASVLILVNGCDITSCVPMIAMINIH